MEMIANNPKMAKKVGVPQSVGKEFVQADKGKKFTVGGVGRTDLQKANKAKTDHGQSTLFKKGGKVMADKMEHSEKSEMKMDLNQDKKMIKKAFAMHDKQEHKGGKGTNLTKLKSGGMACGVKKMARGGGCEVKGKTKGRMV